MYVREPASAPFVSMAEMMRKFQSGTRDLNLPPCISSLPHGDVSQVMQRKPKLILTRPKEPEFETSQRVRSVKIKSSAELEEEMMAKIPKFKACPINRKKEMVGQRAVAYNGVNLSDLSIIATEWKRVLKWLGSRASEDNKAHPGSIGGDMVDNEGCGGWRLDHPKEICDGGGSGGGDNNDDDDKIENW